MLAISFAFTLLLSLAVESPADLVLLGGKVVTLDARQPEAEAVASRGDRIIFVGRSIEARKLVGPKTRIIDARGKLVIPGFIEGHGHFVSLGESKQSLDLTTAKNWDEIVAQVKQAAGKTPPGKWIVGRGWHQEKWQPRPEPNIDGYPTHTPLSRVSPDHPVLLTHGTGHMVFANAKAMELAGIDESTPLAAGRRNPQRCGRQAHAACSARRRCSRFTRPTIARSPPARTLSGRRDLQEAIRLAAKECLNHGVTSFQDAGTSCGDGGSCFARWPSGASCPCGCGSCSTTITTRSPASLAAIARLAAATASHGPRHQADDRRGAGHARRVAAWPLTTTCPAARTQYDAARVDSRATAELAIEHDYQLCVHAIGDRANREVLDLFERLVRRHTDLPRTAAGGSSTPSTCTRTTFRGSRKLGVIASMQGCHATCDGPFVVRRLGLRAGKGRRLRLAKPARRQARSSSTAPTCPSSRSSPLELLLRQRHAKAARTARRSFPSKR